MSYYPADPTSLTRVRSSAFELVQTSGGKRVTLMTHILYLPQSYDVSPVSGDTLKLSRPGKHYLNRVGYIATNYRVSGVLNQALIIGLADGKQVTGESALRHLQDMWDIYQGRGKHSAGNGRARVPPNDADIPLDELEMVFTNLDEPEAEGMIGEGSYTIAWQPTGGFTFSRQSGRLDYRYSLSFTCLQPSEPSEAARTEMGSPADAFEKSLATMRSDAAWSFATAAGDRLARDAIDALAYREQARSAMESRPWSAGGTIDIPPEVTVGALAALAAIGAGV